MFDISGVVDNTIASFFANLFDQIINLFGDTLANVMEKSLNVVNLPIVQSGVKYTQILAISLLIIKVIADIIGTYLLYRKGDPDNDPTSLLVGVAQAVAVIATLPWIVIQTFTFGTKLSHDVANLASGQAGISDWGFFTALIVGTGGTVVAMFAITIAICLLIVAIQATIRGAELALMSVLGPIMAVNLSSNNSNMWNMWFKQLIIICTTQAIQIFMLQGALSLLTSQAITSAGLLIVFGWLWVTIKTPKFVQQFAYSTGFGGAVGGGAKQASSMFIMRKMMK